MIHKSEIINNWKSLFSVNMREEKNLPIKKKSLHKFPEADSEWGSIESHVEIMCLENKLGPQWQDIVENAGKNVFINFNT